MRELLPKDGMRYQCSFELTPYNFRCDNDATEGLHFDDMPDIPKNVALNGRALCETHLLFFGK